MTNWTPILGSLAEFCGRYLGKRVDLPGQKLALARLNDST